MFPRTDVHSVQFPGCYVSRVLCFKCPMFLRSYINRSYLQSLAFWGFYVHRVLCFPKTYVPRFIRFHSCISKGPMLTGSYGLRVKCYNDPIFPRTYIPRDLCSRGQDVSRDPCSQRLLFWGSASSEDPGPRDLCFQILCSQWLYSQRTVFPK